MRVGAPECSLDTYVSNTDATEVCDNITLGIQLYPVFISGFPIPFTFIHRYIHTWILGKKGAHSSNVLL